MTSDKQNLRKSLMAQRKAHHRAHGATAGDKLVEQFLAHSILPSDHLTFAAYLPVGSEIDPRPLMHHLQSSGHRLCLPFCEAADQAASFRAYQLGDDLADDGLGIAAPQKTIHAYLISCFCRCWRLISRDIDWDAVAAPMIGLCKACARSTKYAPSGWLMTCKWLTIVRWSRMTNPSMPY